MDGWVNSFPFGGNPIFRGHVSSRECNSKLTNPTYQPQKTHRKQFQCWTLVPQSEGHQLPFFEFFFADEEQNNWGSENLNPTKKPTWETNRYSNTLESSNFFFRQLNMMGSWRQLVYIWIESIWEAILRELMHTLGVFPPSQDARGNPSAGGFGFPPWKPEGGFSRTSSLVFLHDFNMENPLTYIKLIYIYIYRYIKF